MHNIPILFSLTQVKIVSFSAFSYLLNVYNYFETIFIPD